MCRFTFFSILAAFLLAVFCIVGCSICRIQEAEPCYDKVIKHNVLDENEVIRPRRIVRKTQCDYFTINSSEEVLWMTKSNSLYCIKANINLSGKTLRIPSGCLLYFDGGSFSNGTVIGNRTVIVSKDYEIFKHGVSTYRAYSADSYKYLTKNVDAIVIEGTWLNSSCGDHWTGMLSLDNNHCASLAINNYIKLHKRGQEIVFPDNKEYYVYDRINCSENSIDFRNSVIRSIDFDKVEDTSIILTGGNEPKGLKSIYGLLAFVGDNLTIKNLTIDGRARTRNEIPVRGTECLISMGSNVNCQLLNVRLEDAVGCGICTYAIKDCTFQNVTVNGCGEHGVYTHAYRGTLCFNNCSFINCGRDSTLFSLRGASACVNFSGSRDHGYAALKNLKAIFTDCLFESNSTSQYVATFYSDITKVDFVRCAWKGSVKGYSIVSPKLSEQTESLVELLFLNCTNPCSKINSVNTIRRLIGCRNVTNPFSDTIELKDCEIWVGYADVENKYTAMFEEQYDNPVICANCLFVKGGDDVSVRNTIKNPRPMVFDHCKWDFKTSNVSTYKGTYFLVFSNQKKSEQKRIYVDFLSCVIDIDKYRLLFCTNADILFDSCEYLDSCDTLINAQVSSPNRVRVINMRNPKKQEIARNSLVLE